LEETPESNKKPEENTEEIKEEKEVQQESEPVEEKIEEPVKEEVSEEKEIVEEPAGEPKEADVEEESEKPIEEEKPVEEPKKEAKPEEKKAPPKPKKEHDKDFKYIVRIANTDIDGEKTVIYGLASIKGIGLHMANLVVDATGIKKYDKIGDLDDKKIEILQQAVDSITNDAPYWMMNHRKDLETGKDIHLIGSEIDMKLRDEINMLKKIRSYRGIRHERGLPVRGQRTRANNRKGLALGVSKKRTPGQ